jgi:hypothetical protein
MIDKDTATSTTTATLGDLVRIVGAMSQHVSTDAARQGLCAVVIGADQIMATDSYTAAIFTPTAAITAGDTVMIDGRELLTAITNANKALKRDGEPTVEIVSDGRRWVMTATGATATTTAGGNVIDTPYPNVNAVFNSVGRQVSRVATDGRERRLSRQDHDGARQAHVSGKYRHGKADTPLVIKNWQGNAKPIQFETTTELGTLAQLLMPVRLP